MSEEKTDWEKRRNELDARDDENWRQMQEARARDKVGAEKHQAWIQHVMDSRMEDKRDNFAQSTLNGWLVGRQVDGEDPSRLCAEAYRWADAMMAARVKK